MQGMGRLAESPLHPPCTDGQSMLARCVTLIKEDSPEQNS